MSPQAYGNRYEIKYLVEARRAAEVEAKLGAYLTHDGNGAGVGYYNHSIYFDSPDYRFYSEKHEGELVRIKPRIRAYRPAPDAPPTGLFLELKGRYDRIIDKRRAPIDIALAERLLDEPLVELDRGDLAHSVMAEFQYLAQRFRLAPSVTVLYHRTAYFGAFYPNVRITFDRMIQCSLATSLDAPSEDFAYAIPPNWLVIELKYNDKIPGILLGQFNSLNLQQWTFSKYAVSLERCFDGLAKRRARR